MNAVDTLMQHTISALRKWWRWQGEEGLYDDQQKAEIDRIEKGEPIMDFEDLGCCPVCERPREISS
jgi:hypothetical protein